MEEQIFAVPSKFVGDLFRGFCSQREYQEWQFWGKPQKKDRGFGIKILPFFTENSSKYYQRLRRKSSGAKILMLRNLIMKNPEKNSV